MKIKFIAASILTTLTVACGGGGSTSPAVNLVTAGEFVHQVNNLDPHSYSSTVIKSPTEVYGHVVFFDDGIGEYVAIDIQELRDRGYSAYDAAASYVDGYMGDVYEVVDYYGNGLYEGWETGLLYEETQAEEKDVLFAAKVMEGLKIKKTAEAVAEQYGLSEDQGIKISTMSMHWEKLSKTREMTESDLNAFSEDLFGFNMAEINSAIKDANDGDLSKAESLIDEAANSLETTPENVKDIIEDFSK